MIRIELTREEFISFLFGEDNKIPKDSEICLNILKSGQVIKIYGNDKIVISWKENEKKLL